MFVIYVTQYWIWIGHFSGNYYRGGSKISYGILLVKYSSRSACVFWNWIGHFLWNFFITNCFITCWGPGNIEFLFPSVCVSCSHQIYFFLFCLSWHVWSHSINNKSVALYVIIVFNDSDLYCSVSLSGVLCISTGGCKSFLSPSIQSRFSSTILISAYSKLWFLSHLNAESRSQLPQGVHLGIHEWPRSQEGWLYLLWIYEGCICFHYQMWES